MQSTVKDTRATVLPASFTPRKQEELFDQIVELYDLADNVLASVAAEDATHQREQLELVQPFVTQVSNSTNILSAFYTEVVRNHRPITPELQDTMEIAFRNIFFAYRDFLEGIKHKFLSQEN